MSDGVRAALLGVTLGLVLGSSAGWAGAGTKGGRALLIGIDSYAAAGLAPDTKGASANDVAAVRNLLVTKMGYAEADLKILLNDAATKGAIMDAIGDWLGDGSKPGGKVTFYFSGLGYFETDTGGDEKDGLDEAMVPFDAKVDRSGAKPVLTGLLSDDEFTLALKALEGRDVTIILDAGFSGGVTRAENPDGKSFATARVPQLTGTKRSIVVEPRAKAQKREAGFVETAFGKGSLAVWSAVSASQLALVDGDAEGGAKGVFTKLYTEALGGGKADKNGNGTTSNAELLSFIADGARAYCKSHEKLCEMGLTPRLDPGSAHAATAIAGANTAQAEGAPEAGGKSAAKTKGKGKLTLDKVTDILAKGNTEKVVLKQIPASPVKVGTKNIRFQIASPRAGTLILLNLADDGSLIQLYPNQFSSKHETERTGRLRANSALTVPDSYYGMRFNATAASAGYVVAIVTHGEVDFGETVKTRAIEVIPKEEAAESYLPNLAEKLGKPVKAEKATENTDLPSYSVAVMRYEIVP